MPESKLLNSDLYHRYKGYIDSIQENGLEYRNLLCGDHSEQKAYQLVQQLIMRGENIPDAIVSGNDWMAYGVIKALSEGGISIPEDISVIGFDDANEEVNEKIGLSSVRQPISEMIKSAIDYIYTVLESGKRKTLKKVFKPELIIRRTA
jgi:LacI family transcriptional regulator